ncbi:hypothetical protein UA08_06640 [Talaromyces atroroseus]|uniref:Condensation domain-containing protein n=1 Tax=Talaromyces atroroseus TaxID=1441469 RepID=A0A225AI74_TALAT|nr:hypothetical protein UA08_06640 [Talaromyces atroroseus]OKL57924.1 hypothetical protein UA08_06640 [Talaromyces atroroseus]
MHDSFRRMRGSRRGSPASFLRHAPKAPQEDYDDRDIDDVPPPGSSLSSEHSQPNKRLLYPIIILQRRPEEKSRGWMLAYAPELNEFGIDQTTFLKFLYDFNESHKSSTYLDAVNLAAFGVGFAPGIAPMVISMAVPMAVSYAKKTQTERQSKSYLGRMNSELFELCGLYAVVMTLQPIDQASLTVDSATASIGGGHHDQYRSSDYDINGYNPPDLPQSAPLVFPSPQDIGFSSFMSDPRSAGHNSGLLGQLTGRASSRQKQLSPKEAWKQRKKEEEEVRKELEKRNKLGLLKTLKSKAAMSSISAISRDTTEYPICQEGSDRPTVREIDMPAIMNGQSTDGLSWRETRPRVYERQLDYMELLYHQIGSIFAQTGAEQWCVSICVKIDTETSGDALVQRVKSAWVNMRFKHPEIASTIKEDRRVYEVTDNWESWVANTFEVIADCTARESFSHMPPLHGQASKLYFFSQSNEILIRSSHDRIDARGGFCLLDDLIGVIAKPESCESRPGDEIINLSPSIETAGHFPPTTNDDCDQATALLCQGAVGGLSIGLNASNLGKPPTVKRTFEFVFSEEETMQVIKAVKVKGFTVTQAVQTALALTSKLLGTSDRDFYSSIAVFDLRGICPEELRHRVAAYHSVWPANVAVDRFDSTLDRFKEMYVSFPGRKQETSKTGIYRPLVAAIRGALSVPPPSPNTSVGLSALGVIDKQMTWQHEGLTVTDFWLTLDIFTPNVVCTTWTRAGSMHIYASFNEQYYSSEDVNSFLANMKTILFHGLGIRHDDSLGAVI